MGENPSYVFDVGGSDVEVASSFSRRKAAGFDINETGSGAHIDLSKPYLMVRFHPVWNETRDQMVAETSMLLEAVEGSGFQALWLWTDDDTGMLGPRHTGGRRGHPPGCAQAGRQRHGCSLHTAVTSRRHRHAVARGALSEEHHIQQARYRTSDRQDSRHRPAIHAKELP